MRFRVTGTETTVGNTTFPTPSGGEELLEVFRKALNSPPRLAPNIPEIPFSGGLVGVAAFELAGAIDETTRRGKMRGTWFDTLSNPTNCTGLPRHSREENITGSFPELRTAGTTRTPKQEPSQLQTPSTTGSRSFVQSERCRASALWVPNRAG